MSWFTLLLFVHVVVAIVWAGGGLMMQFFGMRAMKAGDPQRFAALGQDSEWIGHRVFVPSSLIS